LNQFVGESFVVDVFLNGGENILRVFQGSQQFRLRETAHLQFLLGAQFLWNSPLQHRSQRFLVQSASRQERDLIHGDGSPGNSNIFGCRRREGLLGDGRSWGAITGGDRKEHEAKQGNSRGKR
jgi:hypothetical protein